MGGKRGRPRHSLTQRVLNDSFRADRHAPLLVSDELRFVCPWRDARRRTLWRVLRRLQVNYQRERDPDWRHPLALAFGQLVRVLHGGKCPRDLQASLQGRLPLHLADRKAYEKLMMRLR